MVLVARCDDGDDYRGLDGVRRDVEALGHTLGDWCPVNYGARLVLARCASCLGTVWVTIGGLSFGRPMTTSCSSMRRETGLR
jgi:hypothetical protein